MRLTFRLTAALLEVRPDGRLEDVLTTTVVLARKK